MMRAVNRVSTGAVSRARAVAPIGARSKSGTWGDAPLKDDTKLVHAAVSPDKETGAILTPLYLSTTFVQESVAEYLAKGFSYSRTSNLCNHEGWRPLRDHRVFLWRNEQKLSRILHA